eukprot:TRINITY_DN7797_c0_g2_i1.p2 TRINITY_DN7797_c0_g2~~TRINITY_DN7797_c0_g2_i1.p2  ORF type:complete len:603 (+),score=115.41 TRINITY_DN7797_c0_g2_i1:7572-9380(+)
MWSSGCVAGGSETYDSTVIESSCEEDGVADGLAGAFDSLNVARIQRRDVTATANDGDVDGGEGGGMPRVQPRSLRAGVGTRKQNAANGVMGGGRWRKLHEDEHGDDDEYTRSTCTGCAFVVGAAVAGDARCARNFASTSCERTCVGVASATPTFVATCAARPHCLALWWRPPCGASSSRQHAGASGLQALTMLRARAHHCGGEHEEQQEHAHAQQTLRASAGDLVVVHENYSSLSTVTLRGGAFVDNRYGRFSHDHVLERGFGTRWRCVQRANSERTGRKCAGFVHALRPNAQLMAYAMLHRTQIVYPHDAFIVGAFLELRAGSVMVECGTGSGSAATAFATCVAPHGRVLSFEFHAQRAAAAQQHLRALKLSHIVRVHAGVDVLKHGFVGVRDHSVDAVFLDLPAPYGVVAEAARVLKTNGSLCAFSPCVEQVTRTCEQMRRWRFHSLRTLTAPVRTFESVLRQPQTWAAHAHAHGVGAVARTRRRCAARDDASIGARVAKRRRTLGATSAAAGAEATAAATAAGARADAERDTGADAERDTERRHVGRVVRAAAPVVSRPFSVMKAHTSFLTFARKGAARVERVEQRALATRDEHRCVMA